MASVSYSVSPPPYATDGSGPGVYFSTKDKVSRQPVDGVINL